MKHSWIHILDLCCQHQKTVEENRAVVSAVVQINTLPVDSLWYMTEWSGRPLKLLSTLVLSPEWDSLYPTLRVCGWISIPSPHNQPVDSWSACTKLNLLTSKQHTDTLDTNDLLELNWRETDMKLKITFSKTSRD